MAKVIKYKLCTRVNVGTEDDPKYEDFLSPVEIGWNEVNEEIAKKEAYNGEYTVEDNGQLETDTAAEHDAVYDEMAAAYSEGVQTA